MNFGQALKKMRLDRHLGVNQLALKSGVSASQISRYENNTSKNPTTDTIKKLATALNDNDQLLMQLAGYILTPENTKAIPTADGAIISADNPKKKEVEITDPDTILRYEGKIIPKDDLEIIKRLLRGGEE
ncbi:hypothetical protein BSQ39_08325 [Loigolactobacillus backii]|uniref:helix-turn-helix domain-containing protein n=1 Tax=Loigolactobacillus backii TaxID=375175 RepID=UPI000C1CB34F|nr:helix-turn-helix transcriptional regulator [Loigolactobacillus backii]PIO83568.1 hypothetical protein BSQ39_08325 [Loigolactobacillus backii]